MSPSGVPANSTDSEEGNMPFMPMPQATLYVALAVAQSVPLLP